MSSPRSKRGLAQTREHSFGFFAMGCSAEAHGICGEMDRKRVFLLFFDGFVYWPNWFFNGFSLFISLSLIWHFIGFLYSLGFFGIWYFIGFLY
jgi:hypothetical protein